MTETTRELFEHHQVRKTKRQKTSFIDYALQTARDWGYEARIEKGAFGVRNIVIGDPDTAKVLCTAHYDTCVWLPFPNFITPKNFFIYLLYQFFIVGVFFAAAFGLVLAVGVTLSFLPIAEELRYIIITFLPQVISLGLLLLFFCGPANKHTANDNTSGVTTVLDVMQALPQEQRSKVAFVLFDLEEAGLLGSSSFASRHRDVKNRTLVLNFDCVSDGTTMLFALKKTTKQYAPLLERAFVPTPELDVQITANAFYPSDNSSFRGGVGVAALKRSQHFGILYMDRIHTSRDVIYREENIRFLTAGTIRLAQML